MGFVALMGVCFLGIMVLLILMFLLIDPRKL